ncbi:MAG: nucleoside-diphosphate sugar epimerase/dehydratase [Actinomycetota bacterium]
MTFAAIDAVTVAVSYAAAMGLRGLDEPVALADFRTGFALLLPLIIIVHLAANLLFGVYGHEWEYASVEEAMRLLISGASAGIAVLIGVVVIQGTSGSAIRLIPVGVIVLGSAFAFGGMGAMRFRSRMFSFGKVQSMTGSEPTIVIGTGTEAADLARKGSRGEQPINVVGFISTRDEITARRIADVPILGTLNGISAVVERYDIEQILIAESLDADQMSELVDTFLQVDVRLRIVPQLDTLLSAEGRLQDARDVSVAVLLPRPAVITDLGPVSELLAGKRLLVTGAGGSIGIEITRQILNFSPEAVLAVDHDETHLYDGVFVWSEGSSDLATELCDIRDTGRLEQIFSEFKPDVVFHAAAHKHVPILENSPAEAVKTNITGTANLIDACHRHGVSNFVLISTDKAVAPTSAMGASKRVAEMLTQSAEEEFGHICTHTAVRFGNVLGSRGSVVPTFMRQIQEGGPVTVTDPEMLRYFMTVDEAVQLVLQVSALSEGGEVFVLDMGDPVRIGDLAHRMIRLAGLVPGRDIEVRITGTRPGEKHEEILSLDPLEPSGLSKIQVARPGYPSRVALGGAVADLQLLAHHCSVDELKELLLDVSNKQWSSSDRSAFASLISEAV